MPIFHQPGTNGHAAHASCHEQCAPVPQICKRLFALQFFDEQQVNVAGTHLLDCDDHVTVMDGTECVAVMTSFGFVAEICIQ